MYTFVDLDGDFEQELRFEITPDLFEFILKLINQLVDFRIK